MARSHLSALAIIAAMLLVPAIGRASDNDSGTRIERLSVRIDLAARKELGRAYGCTLLVTRDESAVGVVLKVTSKRARRAARALIDNLRADDVASVRRVARRFSERNRKRVLRAVRRSSRRHAVPGVENIGLGANDQQRGCPPVTIIVRDGQTTAQTDQWIADQVRKHGRLVRVITVQPGDPVPMSRRASRG